MTRSRTSRRRWAAEPPRRGALGAHNARSDGPGPVGRVAAGDGVDLVVADAEQELAVPAVRLFMPRGCGARRCPGAAAPGSRRPRPREAPRTAVSARRWRSTRGSAADGRSRRPDVAGQREHPVHDRFGCPDGVPGSAAQRDRHPAVPFRERLDRHSRRTSTAGASPPAARQPLGDVDEPLALRQRVVGDDTPVRLKAAHRPHDPRAGLALGERGEVPAAVCADLPAPTSSTVRPASAGSAARGSSSASANCTPGG